MAQHGTSDFPEGRIPDDSETECPTAAQLDYEDSEFELVVPEWSDGTIVQFGGVTGIEIDRDAPLGVVDVLDWA